MTEVTEVVAEAEVTKTVSEDSCFRTSSSGAIFPHFCNEDKNIVAENKELLPRSWTVDDVKEFLELHECTGEAKIFADSGIDGCQFFEMNKQTLIFTNHHRFPATVWSLITRLRGIVKEMHMQKIKMLPKIPKIKKPEVLSPLEIQAQIDMKQNRRSELMVKSGMQRLLQNIDKEKQDNLSYTNTTDIKAQSFSPAPVTNDNDWESDAGTTSVVQATLKTGFQNNSSPTGQDDEWESSGSITTASSTPRWGGNETYNGRRSSDSWQSNSDRGGYGRRSNDSWQSNSDRGGYDRGRGRGGRGRGGQSYGDRNRGSGHSTFEYPKQPDATTSVDEDWGTSPSCTSGNNLSTKPTASDDNDWESDTGTTPVVQAALKTEPQNKSTPTGQDDEWESSSNSITTDSSTPRWGGNETYNGRRSSDSWQSNSDRGGFGRRSNDSWQSNSDHGGYGRGRGRGGRGRGGQSYGNSDRESRQSTFEYPKQQSDATPSVDEDWGTSSSTNGNSSSKPKTGDDEDWETGSSTTAPTTKTTALVDTAVKTQNTVATTGDDDEWESSGTTTTTQTASSAPVWGNDETDNGRQQGDSWRSNSDRGYGRGRGGRGRGGQHYGNRDRESHHVSSFENRRQPAASTSVDDDWGTPTSSSTLNNSFNNKSNNQSAGDDWESSDCNTSTSVLNGPVKTGAHTADEDDWGTCSTPTVSSDQEWKCTETNNRGRQNDTWSSNSSRGYGRGRGGQSYGNRGRGGQSYGNRDGQSYGNRDGQSYGNRDGQSYGNRDGQSYGNRDGQSYGNRYRGGQSYGNRDRGDQSFGNRDRGGQSFGNRDRGEQSFGNRDVDDDWGTSTSTVDIKPKTQDDDDWESGTGTTSTTAILKDPVKTKPQVTAASTGEDDEWESSGTSTPTVSSAPQWGSSETENGRRHSDSWGSNSNRGFGRGRDGRGRGGQSYENRGRGSSSFEFRPQPTAGTSSVEDDWDTSTPVTDSNNVNNKRKTQDEEDWGPGVIPPKSPDNNKKRKSGDDGDLGKIGKSVTASAPATTVDSGASKKCKEDDVLGKTVTSPAVSAPVTTVDSDTNKKSKSNEDWGATLTSPTASTPVTTVDSDTHKKSKANDDCGATLTSPTASTPVTTVDSDTNKKSKADDDWGETVTSPTASTPVTTVDSGTKDKSGEGEDDWGTAENSSSRTPTSKYSGKNCIGKDGWVVSPKSNSKIPERRIVSYDDTEASENKALTITFSNNNRQDSWGSSSNGGNDRGGDSGGRGRQYYDRDNPRKPMVKREGDWSCDDCGWRTNFSWRKDCYRCETPKPEGCGESGGCGYGGERNSGRGFGNGRPGGNRGLKRSRSPGGDGNESWGQAKKPTKDLDDNDDWGTGPSS